MSKEKEEVAGIIPENEWQPDLEKDVEYYYSMAVKPTFISTKRYTTNKYPEKFKDSREEQEYQLQEIQRLIEGYDGLCGKGYGFLHYAKIRDPEKGKISPEFRVRQEEYFRAIEYHQKNPGRGLVGYKRRRWGFTTIGGWDDWHDCATKPFYMIGGNSKSEADSRKMFKHVKFIHQNVPDWLRPVSSASDRRDFMEFAKIIKDSAGNRKKQGLQSWISVVSPVPENHEGEAYSKLRIDEAGKIECLLDIWAFGEDCLNLNTRRVGLPVILGTVGSIQKGGKGLMELYLNNEAYDLDRFAVLGYHGLIIDEFGNDLVKEAIRWIIYQRHKRKSTNRKIQEAFLQKYPLCDNDAFNEVTSGGIGNTQLINTQIIKLVHEPAQCRTGWMRAKSDGGVDFVPNPEGKVIVYETPHLDRVNAYCAGADPSDHDSKKKKAGNDVSDLALAIVAKPFGLDSPKLVLEYVDRPDKLDNFFEQSAMALKWYNNTKVLIEDNRARMLNYFKKEYPQLLPLVPVSMLTARGGFEMKNSITMTEGRKQQGIGLVEDNIDHYCSAIPSVKLLEQFKVFGDLHADDDLAMAYLLAMIMLQADKKVAKTSDEQTTTSSHQYKNVNGVIRLVTTGQPQRRFTLPKHPILNK